MAASLLRSPELLSILAVLNCAVVWMISILLLVSSSPSLFSRPLRTIPRTPTTISITITFHVPQLFQPSGKIQVFVYIFTFFCCKSVVHWNSTSLQVLFLFINTRCGFLDRIEWSICIFKSQIILWVSFSWTDSGLCIAWSNFNLLPNSL